MVKKMGRCDLNEFKDIVDKFNDLVMNGNSAKNFTIARHCPTEKDELFLYFTGKYFTYGKTTGQSSALILYMDQDNSIELKRCEIHDDTAMKNFPDFEEPRVIYKQLMFVSEENAHSSEIDERDQTYAVPDLSIQ